MAFDIFEKKDEKRVCLNKNKFNKMTITCLVPTDLLWDKIKLMI